MNNSKDLSAATFHKLDDGYVGRVVDDALQRVLNDCDDRPSLEKGRKVTIEIEVKPHIDEKSRSMRGVKTTVSVTAKVPATGTRTEFLRTSHNTSSGIVSAALPDSYQDGLNFDSNEGKGN